MIIKQNIQMQQMVDNNNINQLYPYTKSECVIVQDSDGVSAPVYLNEKLEEIEDFCDLLEEELSELISE